MPLTVERQVAGASYRLAGTPAGSELDVVLRGHWTAGATESLAVDFAKVTQAMKAAGALHGTFRTLVDMRGKRSVQGDTVADFRRFLHANSPSRRVAILSVPADLPLACAALIAAPDRVAIFYDEATARAWLRAAEHAAAA